jgi:hypothetical protein
MKPKIKTMQDADGKQDGTSQQEAPQALSKTGKNVRKPRSKTKESNQCRHYFSSFRAARSAFFFW